MAAFCELALCLRLPWC